MNIRCLNKNQYIFIKLSDILINGKTIFYFDYSFMSIYISLSKQVWGILTRSLHKYQSIYCLFNHSNFTFDQLQNKIEILRVSGNYLSNFFQTILSRFFFSDKAVWSREAGVPSSPAAAFPLFIGPLLTTFTKFRAGDEEEVIEDARTWDPRFNVSTALNSFGIWSNGSVLPVPGHALDCTRDDSFMVFWDDKLTLIPSMGVCLLIRPSRDVRLWKLKRINHG